MKKKFFFAALATIALASCTTDESVFEGIAQGDEINFAVAKYTPQTRAEHDSDVAFADKITIWSWYNGSNTPVINADVYEGTKFVNGNVYYWPVDDKSLDFVAVPTSLVGTAYFTAPGRANDGATALTFAIPADDDYHSTNLMATQVLTGNRSTGTVALLFRHLLAKLNINVEQKVRFTTDARWTVTINSIKVSGLKGHGDVAINDSWTAENGGLPRFWDNVYGNYTWDVTSGDHALYASLDADASKTDFASAATYYMLPQALEDGLQQITIDYTVVTDYLGNPTQPNTVETYTRTFDLKGATAISKWAMNKVITYNIAIDPTEELNPIAFTVNEEEWGTEPGTTPDVDPIP